MVTSIKKSLLGGLASVQAVNPRVAFAAYMKKPPGIRDPHQLFNDIKKCFRGSRNDLADLFVSYIRLLAQDEDYRSAEELMKLALKEQETELCLSEALRLAVEMHQYPAGIGYAKKLLELRETAETHSDLSYCHYMNKEHQEALKSANTALDLNGDCVNALLNKGLASHALGDIR